jgi:hypothetical protein
MEAEQYTSDANFWLGTDVFVDAQANPQGTPANAIVGILYRAICHANAHFIRPFDLGTPHSGKIRQLSIVQKAV